MQLALVAKQQQRRRRGVAMKIDVDFDILMLLGNNYGVTIYKNSQRTTATPFNNKVLIEILDRNFFR